MWIGLHPVKFLTGQWSAYQSFSKLSKCMALFFSNWSILFQKISGPQINLKVNVDAYLYYMHLHFDNNNY